MTGLPQIIIERGRSLRKADDRRYRINVAHKAQALMVSINTEAGKREANAERAASRARVGQ